MVPSLEIHNTAMRETNKPTFFSGLLTDIAIVLKVSKHEVS